MTPLPVLAVALHEPATPPRVVIEEFIHYYQTHAREVPEETQAALQRVVTDETWRRAG